MSITLRTIKVWNTGEVIDLVVPRTAAAYFADTSAVADGADLQAAQALVAKRLPSLQRLDHQARYRRLAGQLARRGFGPGVISTVLRDLPRAGDDSPDPDPFAT